MGFQPIGARNIKPSTKIGGGAAGKASRGLNHQVVLRMKPRHKIVGGFLGKGRRLKQLGYQNVPNDEF
jgi:hypothetical protein